MSDTAPLTAIISITDKGDDTNTFYQQEWLCDILEIQFDDVIEGGRNCITKEQAGHIADFALSISDKAERIIVHCEYGQSRSAGVAAALCEHFEGHDNGISHNPHYFPNWTCYKRVMEALKQKQITNNYRRNLNDRSRTDISKID